MKILFITAGYLPMPPVQGGAVENLIDLFLVNNELTGKHEIVVYSCYSKEVLEATTYYTKTNFKYIKTNGLFFKLYQLLFYFLNTYTKKYRGNAFIRLVRKELVKGNEDFDIVIVENRPEYIIPLRKVLKGRVALHLHNDYIHKGVRNSKNILDLYNEVFSVSNYIKNRVLTVESSTPVKTLFNGIDMKRFDNNLYKEEIQLLKKKYGIQQGEVVILYTGRLNASKGVKELVKAFVSLPTNVKAKLVIAGSSVYGKTIEDPYLSSLKEIAERKSKQIIFTGYVDYTEIPKYYAMADIGVVPSIEPEAFALTVLEHLACSNPVITTQVGGIADIVNSECAIKVNCDGSALSESIREALIFLCTNEGLRNEMSLAAKKTAEQFNVLKYLQDFDRFLNKIT